MTADIIPFTKRIEDAWRDYCEASAQAQKSQDIADGIAAGHAWRRWLALFQPPGNGSARAPP